MNPGTVIVATPVATVTIVATPFIAGAAVFLLVGGVLVTTAVVANAIASGHNPQLGRG